MKKTTRNYVWVLAANALLIGAIAGVWQFRLKAPNFDEAALKPLPRAIYLRGLKQESDIADLKGQWTLVNLWASWCAPCITEMPSLEALSNDYKNSELQVIAISLDEAKNAPAFKEILTRLKFGETAAHWDHKGEVYKALNPAGLPITYIIDPKGRIYDTVEGERNWSSPEIRAMIDRILKL